MVNYSDGSYLWGDLSLWGEKIQPPNMILTYTFLDYLPE